MDCDGSNLRWLTEGRLSPGHEPTWSPDGQRLVFGENSGYLYIVNADGSNRTQITSPEGPVVGDFPSWSPDGTRIAFHGGPGICTIHPDGSNLFCVISFRDLSGAGEAEFVSNKFAWSPDSQRIAFTASPLASHISPGPFEYRLYVVNADGTGLIKLGTFESHVQNAASRWPPAWSPDGKQIGVEIDLDEMSLVIKRYLFNADGSGEMVEIDSIPESWYPWYWPQWDIR